MSDCCGVCQSFFCSWICDLSLILQRLGCTHLVISRLGQKFPCVRVLVEYIGDPLTDGFLMRIVQEQEREFFLKIKKIQRALMSQRLGGMHTSSSFSKKALTVRVGM